MDKEDSETTSPVGIKNTRYSSDIAQTVEATGDFVRSNNPILVCFIVSVVVFCGIFYFQVNAEKERTRDIVEAVNKMSQDDKESRKDVSEQLKDVNQHLNNIEQGLYAHVRGD